MINVIAAVEERLNELLSEEEQGAAAVREPFVAGRQQSGRSSLAC